MTETTDPQTIKSAIAATLRAMAHRGDVAVHYLDAPADSAPAAQNDTLARIPDPTYEGMDAVARSQADRQALWMAYHDKNVASPALSTPEAQAAFNALELARVEALGARHMLGVRRNLQDLSDLYAQKMDYAGADSAADVPLPHALHVLVRAALTNETPTTETLHLNSLYEAWLTEKLGRDGLEGLRKNMSSQEGYAQEAVRLIRDLGIVPSEDDTPDEMEADDEAPTEAESDNAPENHSSEEQDSGDTGPEDDAPNDLSEQGDAESSHDEETEMRMEETDGGDGDTPMATERPAPQDESASRGYEYRIYTTKFDETVSASKLAEPEELARLREILDTQMTNYHGMTTRLANRLQRKLMALRHSSWLFDQEEGMLDTSRLARMVANPNVHAVFKQEHRQEYKDTIVTLLIDNSGSMRGRPIAIAAICTDILARTLERCGVKVEILGFTTRAWKGGRSRDLWIENGRPNHPGRLNDLRHIIYKAADQPWRRANKNLGLMLKEGILKENIDGEALAWAVSRLQQRTEHRKILMVVSDGAPVDDSTLSANNAAMLETDLHETVHWIEHHTDIELAAIGIGHNVGRYYRRALTISDADALAEALMNELEELLTEKKR